MADAPNRVVIDRVDWPEVLPVLRLVSALRHALQPGKLTVALVAVLALHGAGLLMDAAAVGQVEANMLDGTDEKIGVYEAFVIDQSFAFDAMVGSTIDLQFWSEHGEGGLFEALTSMFIAVPVDYFNRYPWFTLAYGVIALVILTLAGGVICRMATPQVCSGQATSLPKAARAVRAHWPWYLLTPLMPALLILLLGGVLILAGLVFFNAAVLDVIGSLLYGLLLLLGFVIALVTLLLIFALFLMTPALSVERADGFDAISRSFNYVLFKPWQFAGYLMSSAVYAVVVFIVISALWGLTNAATEHFVGLGAISEVDAGKFGDLTRHEAMLREAYTAETDASVSFDIAATLVRLWQDLLYAIVAAVMFSVVCCLQTRVYVLMRSAADGTPLDEYAEDDEQDPWSSPEDMVDPEAQAIAAAGPTAAARPADDQQRPEPEG